MSRKVIAPHLRQHEVRLPTLGWITAGVSLLGAGGRRARFDGQVMQSEAVARKRASVYELVEVEEGEMLLVEAVR